MMKSTLFAGVVAAASLGLAGLAQAQTVYPMATYPTYTASPYEQAMPLTTYQLDGAITQEQAHCTPLGVPPNGIGALPASNHPCP